MSTNQAYTSRTVVTTKYYGPTNTRGARIKVSTRNGSKFIPFDHAAGWGGIDMTNVANATAELLQDEHATADGDTYVVVEAAPVGGPKGDADYWIVTYTRITACI